MSRFILFILIISSFLFAFSSSAQTTTPDFQAVIKQLQDQIKLLNQQIVDLQSRLKKTEEEVEVVKAELKITKSLRKGESGDEVRQLQEFLKQFPDIYPEGIVTGFFGSFTETAIKRFQEKHGIESIGIVGPKTIQKLSEFSVSAIPAIPAVPAVPGVSPAIPALPVSPSLPFQPASPSQPIVSPATPAIPAIPAVPGVSPVTPAVPATPAQPSSSTSTSTPTPINTTLLPPVSVIVSLATGKISVTWSSGLTPKYTVYRSVNGGSYQIWYGFITNTYFDDLDGNLNQGSSYRYKVYGCDSSGYNCSTTGIESNSITYTGGNLSCSGLNLTLKDGKTTFVLGVDGLVNYTWTCAPGGNANYVAMRLYKPDGSSILLNTFSGSSPTQTLGFGTGIWTPGLYTLKACFDESCNNIKASIPFTILSGSTPIPTPTPTLTTTPLASPTASPSYSPTPTPTPTPIISSNKPATITYEGTDGTWCYDSDGFNKPLTKGYCQDNTGTYNDNCYPGYDNIANDYSCGVYGLYSADAKPIGNTTRCVRDGWTCTGSLGNACSDGICVNTATPTPTPTPTPAPTGSVSFSPLVPATASILDSLKSIAEKLSSLLLLLGR